ncbi:MBL fold metallo-hydrolase [Halocola ammonii]
MLHIQSFTFSPFQENTYVLFDDNNSAAIVDPGVYDSREQKQLVDFIESKNLKVEQIVNTHCHIDHVFGNDFCVNKYDVPLRAHEADKETLQQAEIAAKMYGLDYTPSPEPTFDLKEGDTLEVGDEKLEIRFAPGHAPGHVVFVHHDSKTVIGGDVLFRGSIGRTDLPGGNHDQLLKSISEKMYSLPDDFTVHSGHGPETTIGFEKANNPFVRG